MIKQTKAEKARATRLKCKMELLAAKAEGDRKIAEKCLKKAEELQRITSSKE